MLIALAPSWPQIRAAAIALEGAAVCVGVASLLPAVRAAEGDGVAAQGAILLVVLVLAMAGAAALQAWTARAEEERATPLGNLPRLVRPAVALAVVLALAPFAAAALDPDDTPRDPAFGATTARFADVGSRRFDYWEAAVKGFADAPLIGQGAGGYQAVWLEERDGRERVVDAHSLELETAAELGLVGLALLALVLGGVALAAARVRDVHPGLAAALAVYAAHSAIDWDWEMPALTLVAVVLAGAALAAAADRVPQLGDQRPLPG